MEIRILNFRLGHEIKTTMASNASNKKSNKRLSGQTSIQSFFKTTKPKIGSNDENQDGQVVQNTETVSGVVQVCSQIAKVWVDDVFVICLF